MNLIIVAALGLLILAVLMFIFSGKINVFLKGTSDCEEALGGTCETSKCVTLGKIALMGGTCKTETGEAPKYCCKTAG